MSEKKILVIDDSATIRRLVDRALSPAGFRVLLASTAEEGWTLAEQTRPDLILLDHQLPGTTGAELCRRILESPALQDIPVVVSSTLRKRAYVEYTDLPNVVDMLPKPYSAELLATTVANALDTGSLIVESQQQGTAVPEVVQQLGEPDLSGTFKNLGVRELLDFLNNAGKSGVLDVEAERERFFFFLQDGRILGVSASGVEPEEVINRLPESLQSLAPVVNLTIGCRASSELDGLLELLDRKVLDPRLLRKLLRHQAAMLTLRCFRLKLGGFHFVSGIKPPPLPRKLPLDSSLLALLIEGALLCRAEELPQEGDQFVYARRAIRGQNLDRAGVSAQHLKLFNLLTEPRGSHDLARQSGCDETAVRRVLFGLVLSELVERQARSQSHQVVVFETDAASAQQLRPVLDGGHPRYFGKVVRDRLALQLVLKRARPDVLVFSLDNPDMVDVLRELRGSAHEVFADVKWVGIVRREDPVSRERISSGELGFNLDATIARPYSADQLLEQLDTLFGHAEASPQLATSAAPLPEFNSWSESTPECST
jgi:CheY-like chemotaxis protein